MKVGGGGKEEVRWEHTTDDEKVVTHDCARRPSSQGRGRADPRRDMAQIRERAVPIAADLPAPDVYTRRTTRLIDQLHHLFTECGRTQLFAHSSHLRMFASASCAPDVGGRRSLVRRQYGFAF